MDDLKCITLVLAGDKQVFRVLLERYEHKVYGFVRKLIKDAQLAEDITQETFLSVYRNLSQYNASKPFSTWLFAIAKNATFKALSQQSRLVVSPEDELYDLSNEKDLIEPQVLAEEVNETLRSALETLTDLQNTVITLRYFEDLSLTQISERTGLTPKKVENILYSSKKKLKLTLREYQEELCHYAKTI